MFNNRRYFKFVEEKIENEIIRERILYLLKWYSRRATLWKIFYFISVIIGIVAPTIMTFINGIDLPDETILELIDKRTFLSLLSTISIIVAGILAITRWHDGWLRYRRAAEMLTGKLICQHIITLGN